MNEKQTIIQFIIQVDCPGCPGRPGRKLDMQAICALFEGTGVQLDSGYGPIVINPKLGRHIVRGTATLEAKAKAERIPGVRFFTDAKVKPAN